MDIRGKTKVGLIIKFQNLKLAVAQLLVIEKELDFETMEKSIIVIL